MKKLLEIFVSGLDIEFEQGPSINLGARSSDGHSHTYISFFNLGIRIDLKPKLIKNSVEFLSDNTLTSSVARK